MKSNIKVVRKADQWELYRELNDPNNRAVFWVSHAAYLKIRTKGNKSQNQNVSPAQVISDYRGDNVAPVFKNTHSDLKFVAVIGCQTDQILGDLSPPSFLAHGKIRGPKNLKKAISKFQSILITEGDELGPKMSESVIPQDWSRFLKIRRSMAAEASPKWIRSLRVVQNGKILGMIPSILPGEEKDFFILLPDDGAGSPVEIQSAQGVETPTEKILFGDLSVSYQERDYRLFASASGIPFGKTMRVFLPELFERAN